MKFWTSTIAAVALAAAMGGTAVAKEVTIKMDKMKFVPATVTVAKGDTVVWVNSDTQKQPHNVMANDNAFKSPMIINVGGKFTWKADKPGAHKYKCSIHPGMEGTLTVK